MNLSLFAGSAFHRAHADDLARHGLGFVQAQDCFASVFSDGTWLGVSTDLERTVDRIAARSAKDAATWRKLVEEFPKRAETLFAALSAPAGMSSIASVGWKAMTGAGLGASLQMAALTRATARGWLTDTCLLYTSDAADE